MFYTASKLGERKSSVLKKPLELNTGPDRRPFLFKEWGEVGGDSGGGR